MKIFTAKQTRDLDKYTIENEPVPSIDLMERAATKAFEWLASNFSSDTSFAVVCGPGNNGGDGLVIARMLGNENFDVTVYELDFTDKRSEDFRINKERLQGICPILPIKTADGLVDLKQNVIIDAIFGSGLSRPAEGLPGEVIDELNNQDKVKVSIDIPSGLFCDEHTPEDASVYKADHIITFQMPKMAFFQQENIEYIKDFQVLDIGLDKGYIERQEADMLIDGQYTSSVRKERKKFDHKGTFGHALCIGGSYGKIGAITMTAKAALKAGAGLVSGFIPTCGYEIFQQSIPEAMFMTDQSEKTLTNFETDLDGYKAIAVGPGMGKEKETRGFFKNLLKKAHQPLVIDADGLNIIAEDHLLPEVPAYSILTPHPGEFKRLAGSWENDFEKLDKLRTLAEKYKLVIVLKGAYTTIGLPDGRLMVNTTGNPGMATGGSGDILTGIIAGLFAQGYTSEESAALGVYLHGLAGDIAIEKEESVETFTATDILRFLPQAFNAL